jgi:hypothetical protein
MIFWISILAWNDAFSHNGGGSKQILTYFLIWFSRFNKSNRALPIFMLDLKIRTKLPVGMYILSIEALIQDADSRNSAFLKILKENFKNSENK